MKILILASNPRKDLNLEGEIRHLQEVIERAKNREDLEVVVGFAVRPEDLQGLLLKHEPEIVHFCGHGTGQQGLVLQDDTRIEKLVSTDALSNLFELCSQWVKCVLLNACYSEVQANAIIQHIDYAIGMNHEIRDDAAIAFATGFYQALGYGQHIEQSYKFGCNAIQLQISDNSNFRSALSEEKRKFEVATTMETVVIPEHLKPVLKMNPNLASNVDKSTSDVNKNLLPSTKLDIQSYIDKALEKENALRQYQDKEYLADKNIRFNSHSSSPQKTRILFGGGIAATLALVLTFSFLARKPQPEQNPNTQPTVSEQESSPTYHMTAENFVKQGDARYKLGNMQGAIEDYTQALKLKPDYSLAYNQRGFVRYKLGDMQGAIEDYTQALKFKPDYSLAYTNRGNARYELGDMQGAIEDYTQAAELYQKQGNNESYQDVIDVINKIKELEQ